MAFSRRFLLWACFTAALCAQPSARPALTYERMFGGRNTDSPTSVTTDLQGNVIVVGTTDSVDFPTTAGSFMPSLPSPLQVRPNSAAAFQDVRLGPVAKVNVIAFSADGSTGYLDASTLAQQDAIYRTADGGLTWTLTASHLPYMATSLVIDPASPSTVYALNGYLLKSTDSGDTWTNVTYPPKYFAPSFLAIDPANSNRLFLVLGWIALFRSTDGGGTWTLLTTGLPYSPNFVVFDRNQPNLIYTTGSFANVFRSRDGGDTWTQLLPGTSPSFDRSRLTVDSNSALYVATSAGVYRSTNGGDSYTLLKTPDGGYLGAFLVDPRDASHYFLSSYLSGPNHLFESHDSGATWNAVLSGANSFSGLAIGGSGLFAFIYPAPQVFVTKWNSLTGAITYATYLGPSSVSARPKVVADSSGYIYVSGGSSVSKLSPDLSQLVWSTSMDAFTKYQPAPSVTDLQVDAAGSVFVGGSSCAPDFPSRTIGNGSSSVPTGPSYTISCGPNPGGAFVAKLNPAGGALVYAAYLQGADTVLSLALSPTGTLYASGPAANLIFPGFNGIGPRGPSYLAKITPDGSVLQGFAKLNANASATSIALVPSGDLLVTGATNTSLLPGFLGAFKIAGSPSVCSAAYNDAYVLRTTADLQFTAFSFLGGGCEEGQSIRADRFGNIWVSGFSFSKTFAQSGYQSAGLGFIAELTPNANALLFSSRVDYSPQLNISREGTVFLASSTSRFGGLMKTYDSTSAGGAGLLTRLDP